MKYYEILDIRNAIKAKNYNGLYEIIEKPDFDINQESMSGWTPLLVAIDLGDEKLVATFLKMGANPNCVMSVDEYSFCIGINYT